MENKRFLKGLLAVALFSAATFAQALVVDTLLGKTKNANSGPTAELAGLTQVLAGYNMTAITPILLTGSLVLEQSFDIGSIMQSGVGTFYYDVAPATPSFFLLKFGGGNKEGAFTDYYFANIDDFSKLVFTNAQVDNLIKFADCSVGDCRLSHYTLFNSPTRSTQQIPIPEPALPLLLGAGLMGFYLTRRTRRA